MMRKVNIRLASLIFLGLTLFIPVNSVFAEMQEEDKLLFNSFLALELIDWAQTLEIARNEDYIETNPILGENPSEKEVNLYFISCIGINYMIAKSDWKYKKLWLTLATALQAYCTTHNYRMGVRIW